MLKKTTYQPQDAHLKLRVQHAILLSLALLLTLFLTCARCVAQDNGLTFTHATLKSINPNLTEEQIKNLLAIKWLPAVVYRAQPESRDLLPRPIVDVSGAEHSNEARFASGLLATYAPGLSGTSAWRKVPLLFMGNFDTVVELYGASDVAPIQLPDGRVVNMHSLPLATQYAIERGDSASPVDQSSEDYQVWQQASRDRNIILGIKTADVIRLATPETRFFNDPTHEASGEFAFSVGGALQAPVPATPLVIDMQVHDTGLVSRVSLAMGQRDAQGVIKPLDKDTPFTAASRYTFGGRGTFTAGVARAPNSQVIPILMETSWGQMPQASAISAALQTLATALARLPEPGRRDLLTWLVGTNTKVLLRDSDRASIEAHQLILPLRTLNASTQPELLISLVCDVIAAQMERVVGDEPLHFNFLLSHRAQWSAALQARIQLTRKEAELRWRMSDTYVRNRWDLFAVHSSLTTFDQKALIRALELNPVNPNLSTVPALAGQSGVVEFTLSGSASAPTVESYSFRTGGTSLEWGNRVEALVSPAYQERFSISRFADDLSTVIRGLNATDLAKLEEALTRPAIALSGRAAELKAEIEARRKILSVPESAAMVHPESAGAGTHGANLRPALQDSVRLADAWLKYLVSPSSAEKVEVLGLNLTFSADEKRIWDLLERKKPLPADLSTDQRTAILDSIRRKLVSAIDNQFVRPVEELLVDLRTGAPRSNPPRQGQALDTYLAEVRAELYTSPSVTDVFQRSVRALYQNIRLPLTRYPVDADAYRRAYEYGQKDTALWSDSTQAHWFWRGVDPSKSPDMTWRASLNVHVSEELVKALDQMITAKLVTGYYKFGKPDTGGRAQGEARHDSVTLYFTEEPSEAAKTRLAEIARRHGRGAHELIGEKLTDGASICPSFSHDQLKLFVKNMQGLFPAIGYSLEDSLNRNPLPFTDPIFAISEGQYEAIRIALARLGVKLDYRGPELLVSPLPVQESYAPTLTSPAQEAQRAAEQVQLDRGLLTQIIERVELYPPGVNPAFTSQNRNWFLPGRELNTWPVSITGVKAMEYFQAHHKAYVERHVAWLRSLSRSLTSVTPRQARVLADFAHYGGVTRIFESPRAWGIPGNRIELGGYFLHDPANFLHEAAHFSEPRMLDLFPAIMDDGAPPILRDITTIYRELIANSVGSDQRGSDADIVRETGKSYGREWARLAESSAQQPSLLGGKLSEIPAGELQSRLDQAIARELFASLGNLLSEAQQGKVSEAVFWTRLTGQAERLHWRSSVMQSLRSLSMRGAQAVLASVNVRAFHVLAVRHDLWGRTEADVAAFDAALSSAPSTLEHYRASLSETARRVMVNNPILERVVLQAPALFDAPAVVVPPLVDPVSVAAEGVQAAIGSPGQVAAISNSPAVSGGTAVALPFNTAQEATAFLGSGRRGFTEAIPLPGGLRGSLPEAPILLLGQVPSGAIVPAGNGLVSADSFVTGISGAIARPDVRPPEVSGRFVLPGDVQIWSSTINAPLIDALPDGTTSILTGPALSRLPSDISRALPPAEASLRYDIVASVGAPEAGRLYELAYANSSFSRATTVNSTEPPSWITFHDAVGSVTGTKIDFTFRGANVNVAENSLRVGAIVVTGSEGRFEGLMVGYKGSGPLVPNLEGQVAIPRSAGVKAVSGLLGLFAFTAADAGASAAILDFARGDSLGTVTVSGLKSAGSSVAELATSPSQLGVGIATLPLFAIPGVGQGAVLGAGINFSAKTVEAMDAEGTTAAFVERVAALPTGNTMQNRANALGFVLFGRAMYSIQNSLADDIGDALAALWYDVPLGELDGNSQPLPVLRAKSPEYYTSRNVLMPISKAISPDSSGLFDPMNEPDTASVVNEELWNPRNISSADSVPRPEEWRDYLATWAAPASEFSEYVQALATDTSYTLPTTSDIRLSGEQSSVRLSYILSANAQCNQATGFGEVGLSYAQGERRGISLGLYGSVLDFSLQGLASLRYADPTTGASSLIDGTAVKISPFLTQEPTSSLTGAASAIREHTVFGIGGVSEYLRALYSGNPQSIVQLRDVIGITTPATGGLIPLGSLASVSALEEVSRSMQVEFVDDSTFAFAEGDDVSIMPFRPLNIGEQPSTMEGSSEVVKELERLKAIKDSLKAAKRSAKNGFQVLKKEVKQLTKRERKLLKLINKFSTALSKGDLVVQYQQKWYDTAELLDLLQGELELLQKALPEVTKALLAAETHYKQVKNNYKSVKAAYRSLKRQFKSFNALNPTLQQALRSEALSSTRLAETYISKALSCSSEDPQYGGCIAKYTSSANLDFLAHDLTCKLRFEECRR